MALTIVYLLLIGFCVYIYRDINKELKGYYKEKQPISPHFIQFFSILFNPKEHFKKEKFKEGYKLFLFQDAIIIAIIVLIILIMQESGYNPL